MPKVKAKRVKRKQTASEKRLSPQQKAAITRAKNKRARELEAARLAKKRREAALKAAETRRKNAAKREREAKAKKREENRRAQEHVQKRLERFLTAKELGERIGGKPERPGRGVYDKWYKAKQELRQSSPRERYMLIMRRIGKALGVADMTPYIES